MPSAPALSQDFAKVTLASDSEETVICLLEIRHATLPEPIRLSSDMTAFYGFNDDAQPVYCTWHKGKPYFTVSFGFVPPGAPQDGAAPTASLVTVYEPRIIQAVRDIHDGLYVQATLVGSEDLDTPITEFPAMLLKSVNYEAGQIESQLGLDHFLDRPCGRLKFMPSSFPGLFKNGVTPIEDNA